MKLPPWLLWVILIVAPLAFLLNLGLQPFIDDEANRSLVALEMMWSGNFVTPTLHGDFYYNKPPLWNWMLAVSFSLHGGASEWAARLPSILGLFGFAGTVYYYSRKHFGFERSVLVALMFLTTGRIIFWESLLGLIDITFSWTMYALIMVIYHQGQKERWGRMFLFSYLLMVVGFMFKGLPAIAFQGITLLTYLLWSREFKRFFSWAHIRSGLVALALLAVYYFIYHRYNSLDNVFQALFVESGKRTAVAYSWQDTVKHVLLFPTELFYHFLPWTILLFGLLQRSVRQKITEHPYVRYCVYAFFANLLIYWLSPNFYPRYILMLVPIAWTILAFTLPQEPAGKGWLHYFHYLVFGLGMLVLLSGPLLGYFNEQTLAVPGRIWKTAVAFIALAALTYGYFKMQHSRWFIVCLALLVFRVWFDVMVLPPRAGEHSDGQNLKLSSMDFADRWRGEPVKVFANTQMEPAVSFYLENTLHYVMPRTKVEKLRVGEMYLFNPDQYDRKLFDTPLDSVIVRHTYSSHYYLAVLKIADPVAIEKATLSEPAGY